MPSNAANPSLGTLQAPLVVAGFDLNAAMCECAQTHQYKSVSKINVDDWIKCCILGINRQSCVEKKLKDEQDKGNAKDVHAPSGANFDSGALPKGKKYCRPDMVIGPGPKPVAAPDMKQVIEMKFPCNSGDKSTLPSENDWQPEKVMGGTMKKCYQKIKVKGGKQKKGGVKVTAVGPTKESCT